MKNQITRTSFHLMMEDSKKEKSEVQIKPRHSAEEIIYIRDLYHRVCASPGVKFYAERRDYSHHELVKVTILKE
jgi:hypothetical protein